MPKVTLWRYGMMTEEVMKAMWNWPNLRDMGNVTQAVRRADKEPLKPVPVEDIVKELRELNTRVIVSAVDNETRQGDKLAPEYVADLQDKYPDCFIGFMGADPYKGTKALRELEWAVKTFGFKGVDIQPLGTGIPIDDRKHYPIYAKAEELGIVVFVAVSNHFNRSVPIDIQHPRRLDQVAIDFPDLKIVARHSGWPWILEFVAVCWRHPNIYVELSGMRPRNLNPELLGYVDRVFKDRTVVGVAPLAPLKSTIEEFKQLPLKPETIDNILYKTSARLLNLSED